MNLAIAKEYCKKYGANILNVCESQSEALHDMMCVC